ncbi:hypothetical protein GYMLUDRAFT_247568 [Collybiopsis luxurians FD-317 M1]|uniref:Uncharacterized protein n=1 Tax=Collybiopsis luxurians FD-317 M1 TaxID=944289 RepID=A0A0D0B125_9AGAR|nr:hypothetical protein GYMLUDRAFT_247568 [Collybiopsis luxurians FD-317 M1]
MAWDTSELYTKRVIIPKSHQEQIELASGMMDAINKVLDDIALIIQYGTMEHKIIFRKMNNLTLGNEESFEALSNKVAAFNKSKWKVVLHLGSDQLSKELECFIQLLKITTFRTIWVQLKVHNLNIPPDTAEERDNGWLDQPNTHKNNQGILCLQEAKSSGVGNALAGARPSKTSKEVQTDISLSI